MKSFATMAEMPKTNLGDYNIKLMQDNFKKVTLEDVVNLVDKVYNPKEIYEMTLNSQKNFIYVSFRLLPEDVTLTLTPNDARCSIFQEDLLCKRLWFDFLSSSDLTNREPLSP